MSLNATRVQMINAGSHSKVQSKTKHAKEEQRTTSFVVPNTSRCNLFFYIRSDISFISSL